MEDKPRSLKSVECRRAREAMLNEPHIAPLTAYVKELRKLGRGEVPYFDPMDGGINATILFVLQNPGEMAVDSGFISRNNDDRTACNTFNLLQEAGIPRKRTVLWNIVPWYDETKESDERGKISSEDTEQGARNLQQLVGVLQNLKAIVYVGTVSRDAAWRAMDRGYLHIPKEIYVTSSYHTSQRALNGARGRREKILDVWTNTYLLIKEHV